MNLKKLVIGGVLLHLLAACGGGGGDDNTLAAENGKVPSSALASATAYSQWAGSLVNSESGAPVTVDDGMQAPKSESDEPIGLR